MLTTEALRDAWESLVLYFISFLLKWQKLYHLLINQSHCELFEGLDRASSPTEQSYPCEERPKLVKFRLRLNKTPLRIISGFETKQKMAAGYSAVTCPRNVKAWWQGGRKLRCCHLLRSWWCSCYLESGLEELWAIAISFSTRWMNGWVWCLQFPTYYVHSTLKNSH